MQKKIYSLTAAVALGVFATNANAALISDVTEFHAGGTYSPEDYDAHGYGTVNKLDGVLDFVSWTHHFDFSPAPSKINSGVLSLTLRDDSTYDGIEIGFGLAENGQWDFGLVKSATYSYDLAINSLLDGSFSVTLFSLLGDFFIEKSVLRIDYTPVTSTPEPATLSLLGLGLLGTAFGYRRRKKAA